MLGRAAELGSEGACAVLGLANAEGEYGFDEDPQEATRWYREMQKCGIRDCNSLDEIRERAGAQCQTRCVLLACAGGDTARARATCATGLPRAPTGTPATAVWHTASLPAGTLCVQKPKQTIVPKQTGLDLESTVLPEKREQESVHRWGGFCVVFFDAAMANAQRANREAQSAHT